MKNLKSKTCPSGRRVSNLPVRQAGLKPESRLGFTIVELVVIIGIVGFMSAMVIVGQNQGSDQRQVITETRQLAHNLRKAQNFTISSTTHDCGGAIGTKVVPFGIILDMDEPDRYRLVADCDQDKIYDTDGTDKIISTYVFTHTGVNSLIPQKSPENTLEIFFAPPNPDTYVNGSVSTNATVTLCGTKRSTLCRGVYLTSGGAISVQ